MDAKHSKTRISYENSVKQVVSTKLLPRMREIRKTFNHERLLQVRRPYSASGVKQFTSPLSDRIARGSPREGPPKVQPQPASRGGLPGGFPVGFRGIRLLPVLGPGAPQESTQVASKQVLFSDLVFCGFGSNFRPLLSFLFSLFLLLSTTWGKQRL